MISLLSLWRKSNTDLVDCALRIGAGQVPRPGCPLGKELAFYPSYSWLAPWRSEALAKEGRAKLVPSLSLCCSVNSVSVSKIDDKLYPPSRTLAFPRLTLGTSERSLKLQLKAREASQKNDVMGFCLCVSLRPANGGQPCAFALKVVSILSVAAQRHERLCGLQPHWIGSLSRHSNTGSRGGRYHKRRCRC
jgi:hypothetical protein